MNYKAEKGKSLSSLKREKERIRQEGYILDCWIGRYRPGGTARGENAYYHLRSRKPLENGKYSRHLKSEELPRFHQLIRNGRRLRRIEKEIERVQKRKLSARAVLTSSVSDEWYTPPEYLALVRGVMGGIDIDPASSNTAQVWIKAETYYTRGQNGLCRHWSGRMWLNPPYGTQTSLWIEKALQSYRSGAVYEAVLLVRPAVGSSWYQTVAGLFPSCIPHKRIRFLDVTGREQGSPTHGNAFFYLGGNIERFREVFSAIGVVTRPF